MGYRIISSDDHIYEPPDLWTSRIESRFKERCPQLVPYQGGQIWVCDGAFGQSLAQGTNAGRRYEDPETVTRVDVFENVRPGGYIPEEHVKDMDMDGVDVSILYPTVGLLLFGSVEDSELLTAIFRTYNDFTAEYCSAFPDRLVGIAMINLDDVGVGIEELERCRKKGFVGAMIPVYPPEDKRYYSPIYDPFWAAAQDLEVPLSLHTVTNRVGSGANFQGGGATPSAQILAEVSNADYYVRMSLAHMIYSGVFERYPKLQVGSVEHELSWVPNFLDRIDFNYTQRGYEQDWYRFKEDLQPSDYFHRNVFLGFQEDSLGLRDRQLIGVDNIQWGSDYPHTESTFPRSREILEEILAGCTDGEKAKIAGGNAARVYHLS